MIKHVLRKIMFLPEENLYEFQCSRTSELKLAFTILLWLLIVGHGVAHILNPPEMHPELFLKYRILTILGCGLLYLYIKPRRYINIWESVLLYFILYIDLLFPFVIGAIAHPSHIIGIAQLAFVVSVFYPVSWLIYMISSIILVLFVSIGAKILLVQHMTTSPIGIYVGAFNIFIILSVFVNRYMNKLRLREFLQKKELEDMRVHMAHQEKLASLWM